MFARFNDSPLFQGRIISVSLYLDKRSILEGKPCPVKLVLTENRKTSMIPLGVKVLPSQWDSKSKKVVNRPDHSMLNVFLSGRKSAAEMELLRMQSLGMLNGMTLAQVRDRIVGVQPAGEICLFMDYFRHFLDTKKGRTKEVYEYTYKALVSFDKTVLEKTFEDITPDYIRKFIGEKDSLKTNSLAIHLRNIRAVFNDAIKNEKTQNYPFRQLQIKHEKTRKKALTPEQMRLLCNASCTPRNEEYRDMFVLMFLLRGINIGDLLHATDANIVNGRFEYRRSKVGTLFSIKLEPEALALIEKYRGVNHLLSPLDRYKSHRDYLHHLNHGLQTIGKTRGRYGKLTGDALFPELSSNWARHTWASAGLNLDIPVEVISRGMGHSGALAVTQIYMDFDEKKVDQANRRIIDYVFHKKDYRRKERKRLK